MRKCDFWPFDRRSVDGHMMRYADLAHISAANNGEQMANHQIVWLWAIFEWYAIATRYRVAYVHVDDGCQCHSMR